MKCFCVLQLIVVVCLTDLSKQAPSILGAPIVAYLHEDASTFTEVVCISCTTPDNTPTHLSLLTVTPTVDFFNVSKLPGQNDYCVYFDPTYGSPNYTDIRRYSVDIECSDSATTDTSPVQIRVLANEPPSITSKQFDYCTINARSTQAGQMIHTTAITASDPDQDTLTASFTTSPASAADNYDIIKPSPDFQEWIVVARRDLSVECNSDVTFLISISDDKNTPTDPVYLICTVTNHFITPSITNVDKSIYVSENTAIGSSILVLETIPISDVISYTLETNDTSLNDLFQVSVAEHALKLSSKLNYESTSHRNISMTIQANNGYCTPEVHLLNVLTVDANDPPSLNRTTVSLSIYEGMIQINNTFEPVDHDEGNDTFMYSIAQGNQHGIFTVNPRSGVVSTVIDYDVDVLRLPARQTLVIQIEDIGGAKSYGTLRLTIKDANDNPPEFTSYSQQSETFDISNCTAVGGILGKRIYASDSVDSSFENNNVVSIVPVSNEYLNITSSGDIYYIGHIPVGNMSSLTVYAEDGGSYPSKQRSLLPVTITIYGRECTPGDLTTTTVTMTQKSGASVTNVDMFMCCFLALFLFVKL